MVVPIVPYATPVLREKGARVAAFDSGLRAFAQDLIETLAATETGIGLAAQQIGRALQVCVVDLREVESEFDYLLDGARPPLRLFMPLVLVNPELEFHDDKPKAVEEGCLSFPEIRGPVARQERVTVRFQDLGGARHELVCDGLFGRCVQHEVDHLNGVLFIDRMSKTALSRIEKPVEKLKQHTSRATGGAKT
jgi:peptide deformylase